MAKEKSQKRFRNRNVGVWVSPEEGELMDRAASKSDRPVSSWLRKAGVEKAKKELGVRP